MGASQVTFILEKMQHGDISQEGRDAAMLQDTLRQLEDLNRLMYPKNAQKVGQSGSSSWKIDVSGFLKVQGQERDQRLGILRRLEDGLKDVRANVRFEEEAAEVRWNDSSRATPESVLEKVRTWIGQEKGEALSVLADAAMGTDNRSPEGGIDLKAAGANTTVRQEGKGVEMTFDPAMIERIKREGLEGLTPVIYRMTPVVSIWPLLGLKAPSTEAVLASNI